MAAPSPRTGTHTIQASGTSVVGTAPAGISADDILLAWWMAGSAATAIVAPDGGWMELAQFAASNCQGRLLIMRRGSSNPSFTFSWTTAAYAEVGIMAVSGCDTGPLMFHDFAANMPSTKQNPESPVVQATVTECLAIAFGQNFQGAAGSPGWTAPSGYAMSAIGDATGDDLCVATKALSSAGVENPAAFGNGLGADSAFEATILLMPPQSAAVPAQSFAGMLPRHRGYPV